LVADRQSGFARLAADPLSVAGSRWSSAAALTSPRKPRARSFCPTPSGRSSRRGRRGHGIVVGSRPCAYKTASGRSKWLSRDPIGERGGHNLYTFTANAPVDYIDTDGRFTGSKCGRCGEWYQGFHTCPPPIDCSGYSKLKGVSCASCGGALVADDYPEKAQGFCEGFAKLYTGKIQHRNAACVAQCLVEAEQKCQARYQSCNRRNCCRYLAHFECYAKCVFIFLPPIGEGMPEGAWEFGETKLRPACKSLRSKCPDCGLPNER